MQSNPFPRASDPARSSDTPAVDSAEKILTGFSGSHGFKSAGGRSGCRRVRTGTRQEVRRTRYR